LKNNLSKIILSLFFILTLAGGFLANAVKAAGEIEEYKEVYGAYLSQNKGFVSALKAGLLTLYDSAKGMGENTAFKNTFINLYGLAKHFNPAPCPDRAKTVRLKDGSLGLLADRAADLDKRADTVLRLQIAVKNIGCDLLYIQLPSKIKQDENLLPKYVEDFSVENADSFLAALDQRGVKTYDLRQELYPSAKDCNKLFYRTDHHWKAETGLFAAGLIAEKISREYGLDIKPELFEKDNFNKEEYGKIFLGSLGKRLGKYYAAPDDFCLLTPKYDTNYLCKYHREDGQILIKEGNFRSAWIFEEHIKKDFFSQNVYMAYAGGPLPLIECENRLMGGKTLLAVTDSFGDTLFPFLSAAFERLVIVDPRLYKGSIADLAAAERPDLCLFVINPSTLDNDDFFEFG